VIEDMARSVNVYANPSSPGYHGLHEHEECYVQIGLPDGKTYYDTTSVEFLGPPSTKHGFGEQQRLGRRRPVDAFVFERCLERGHMPFEIRDVCFPSRLTNRVAVAPESTIYACEPDFRAHPSQCTKYTYLGGEPLLDVRLSRRPTILPTYSDSIG
jgi:hypothetical protein